jgi:hypothetical protein
MAVAAASRCWKKKKKSQTTWLDFFLPLFLLPQSGAATRQLGPKLRVRADQDPNVTVILMKRLEHGCILYLSIFRSIDRSDYIMAHRLTIVIIMSKGERPLGSGATMD